MSAYQQLIQKLDDFIRKYYKNQLLKGLIYSVALGFTLFLAVTAAEYFGRFSTPVRAVLLFGFSAALLFILGKYIFLPLGKLFKLGNTISHDQAAQIVGTHFTEVKDKLLNTLQLKKLADENGHNDMLQAAIEQKTAELRPVPFVNAVNLGDNKKYLKYAALPLGVFVFILFAAPSIITDGTKRVVNYGKEFKPEAPFSFSLNQGLTAVENEDFDIEVALGGQEIPQNVYVEYDGARFRMNAEGKTKFSHTVKKVNKTFSFKLFADGFYSDAYTVNVVPKPTLAGLKIRLEYPAYLNKPGEVLTGTGDMTVPEGTRVQWTMSTRNTDELILLLRDTAVRLKTQENKVQFAQKVKNTLPYALTGKNGFMEHGDTNRYLITVIADEYPSIAVEENRDSLYPTLYYFRGEVADDYGFRGLSFHYKKQKPGTTDEKDGGYTVKPLGINGSQNRQPFLHAFNFTELNPEPGDEIVYFFTVYDNDGVNGSKSARTAKRVFRVPTVEELALEDQKSSESIKNSLTESIRDAEKIRKEANELNKSLLQKKSMDWQDRKKVEELLKKQRELEQQIEELKKENEQKNRLKNEFQKPDEQQLEKQKEMEKLLDELMNEELKKMLEELEKLMQQDKNKLQEELKDMQFNSEDLKKQLERTLELYKQMEFDQKLEQTIEKLDKVAEEQKNLAKETAKENAGDPKKQEQLQQKQEEVNKKFEEVRKDIEDLNKKNEALENKREELKDTKPQEQDIQQEQQKAGEQMQNQQNKKAGQSQQNAGEKMEQLSQQMKQMQGEMEQNQQSEDLEALRQILDNLMRLSFDQEELMETIRKTNPNSPKYKELAQQQRKLKDDSKIIEDSLFALSKRVPEIKASVNKEIADIKRNMDDAVQNLSDRETPQALTRQQYTMTSVNNLALMLSEAIENAQQQMQMQMKKGNKACSKPGQGMPSQGEMKKLQEAQKKLSEQMHKMAQQMQQGKEGQQQKPGGQQKQPGQQGTQGEMSKDFAKMAAEQEMIRKQMQEMYEKMGDPGQRKMMQDIMNKMEENETDLYNKRINQQTMMRQRDIEIKMLESEKALREQEQDEQRESKEGTQPALNAEQYQQYLRLKEKQTELLRTVPPALKPYYKQKVSDYFNKL